MSGEALSKEQVRQMRACAEYFEDRRWQKICDDYEQLRAELEAERLKAANLHSLLDMIDNNSATTNDMRGSVNRMKEALRTGEIQTEYDDEKRERQLETERADKAEAERDELRQRAEQLQAKVKELETKVFVGEETDNP